jgi:hypothetical protein
VHGGSLILVAVKNHWLDLRRPVGGFFSIFGWQQRPESTLATQSDSLSQLFLVFLGGSIATILRELISWIRRPELQLFLDLTALKEFEQRSIEEGLLLGWRKFIRLKVHNKGLRAAHYCEAKIEPFNEKGQTLFDPSILHWVRRYAAVYPRTQDQYVPITVNRRDHEFLDVVYIDRSASPPNTIEVKTFSHRPYPLSPNKDYRLKVTVFSTNAGAKSLTISFRWDGTWNGFHANCVNLCSRSESL